MIGFKVRHLVCFLILLIATPLFADVIVIEKGVAGDLRWWNDQVVIRDDTIYFLGHKQNTSNELDYKLYAVDTKTDIKSDIVLTWEDGSPVRVPQNVAGILDKNYILLHWWEPGYYAEGNGAEVAISGREDHQAVARANIDPITVRERYLPGQGVGANVGLGRQARGIEVCGDVERGPVHFLLGAPRAEQQSSERN